MNTTIVRNFTQPTTPEQVSEGTVVSITETSSSPHSIEVNRNAKGEYSHSVKMYSTGEDMDRTINQIKEVYEKLDTHFISPLK